MNIKKFKSINNRLIKIVFFLTFVIFFFTSFDIKSDDSFTDDIKQNLNIELIENQFSQLNPDERWFFLLGIIEKSYENNVDVENWLLIQVTGLFESDTYISPQLLRELNVNSFNNQYDKLAFFIAEKTLTHFKSDTYTYSRGAAAAVFAHHYLLRKDTDSLAMYLDMINLTREIDTSRWIHLTYYSNKGGLEMLKGNHFESAVSYHNAIELTNEADKKNLSVLNYNLASLYINMNYLEKASFYINESLSLVGFDNFPIDLYNNLGIIQRRTGNLDLAEETFQSLLKKATEMNNTGLLASTYANYANLKRELGQFDEALRYLDRSDSICKVLDIQFGLIINNLNRSEVYFEQRKFALADETLKSLETQALSFNNQEIKKELYKLFYKVKDSLNESNSANQYYRLYIENKNRYTGDLPRSVITEWELNREREKKNLEKATLELSLEKQTKEKYLIAFILTLFLMISTLFFIRRNQKIILQKQKLELEKSKMKFDLEINSKELLLYSLKEITVQNTKDWLKDELDLIMKELPTVHKNKLSALSRKLKNQSKEKFLEEFETRFLGIYEEFYKKLIAVAPNLTINELRICALIRLNFSTKEISQITNLHKGTIDNLRSSVRRKLKLDDKTVLKEYLKEV
jgi:DNA-binding CsgD family transcriptional regulator